MACVRSEELRLQALTQLGLLDTPPSESFDRITRMASRIFDLPIAAVSLTDRDRQWFKSRVGVEHWEIPRVKAPCGEVADTAGPLVIPDLLQSPHYQDSPLAQSGIRFYAAAPLLTRDGFSLGAMCVLGTEPREITRDEQSALADLAAMVMAQIELQHAFGRIEPLSGLPNSYQLIEDLQDEARDRPGKLKSLVHLDLADPDRIQEATRVLGPGIVDELVREAALAFRAELGPALKLYQTGMTQIGWLASHTDEDARDRYLAEAGSRLAAFLQRVPLPPLAKPVAGIAPFRLGEVTAQHVLRSAHSAALDARTGAGLVETYSSQADDRHRRRYRLLSDMSGALAATEQLSLAYQPRIDLQSGACVAVEALLRWTHPVLGLVSPGEFIPVVEKTDLSRRVTDWVIEEALRQAQAWHRLGIAMPISVNVSPTDLEQHDFSSRLIRRIEKAELPASALEIEVTESAIIRDGIQARKQLERVRATGVRVAIDDFGTGYSSLSYVLTLPADIIKIDQSFIRDLGDNERGRMLVRSMVAMAKDLGFRVVAEGIEDEAAYECLQNTRCDEGQGYLMSRPLPAERFISWLESRAGGWRKLAA